MDYRIVKLNWTNNQYAVIFTNPKGGIEYAAKYLDLATAQQIYNDLQTKL